MQLHPALAGRRAERAVAPQRRRMILHEIKDTVLAVAWTLVFAALLRLIARTFAGGEPEPAGTPDAGFLFWGAVGLAIGVWRVTARRRGECLLLYGDSVVGTSGDEGDVPVFLRLAAIPPENVGRRTWVDRFLSEARIESEHGAKIVYRPRDYDPEELGPMLEDVRRAAREARLRDASGGDPLENVFAAHSR